MTVAGGGLRQAIFDACRSRFEFSKVNYLQRRRRDEHCSFARSIHAIILVTNAMMPIDALIICS